MINREEISALAEVLFASGWLSSTTKKRVSIFVLWVHSSRSQHASWMGYELELQLKNKRLNKTTVAVWDFKRHHSKHRDSFTYWSIFKGGLYLQTILAQTFQLAYRLIDSKVCIV